ncbi:hypothetical protein, partial [Streptomyces sp. NPDC001948]
ARVRFPGLDGGRETGDERRVCPCGVSGLSVQAEEAKRRRDIGTEIGALVGGHRAVFPTAPLSVGCPAQLSVVAEPNRLERAVTNLVTDAPQHGDGTI